MADVRPFAALPLIAEQQTDGTQRAAVGGFVPGAETTVNVPGQPGILVFRTTEGPELEERTYHFTVTAVAGSVESGPSPVASVTVPPGSTDDTLIVEEWQGVANAEYYNVYGIEPESFNRFFIGRTQTGGFQGSSTGGGVVFHGGDFNPDFSRPEPPPGPGVLTLPPTSERLATEETLSRVATEQTLNSLGFTSQDIHARLADGTQLTRLATPTTEVLTAPSLSQSGGAAGANNFPAGTYSYVATAADAYGESTHSTIRNIEILASNTNQASIVLNVSGGSGTDDGVTTNPAEYRLYRRYNGGAWRLVGSRTTAGTITDTGPTLNPGTVPPAGIPSATVNTSGLPGTLAREKTLSTRASEATLTQVLAAIQAQGPNSAGSSTPATTSARTVVTAATTSTLVLASNTARKKLFIYNSGNVACFISLGATASTTDYSFQLGAGGTYEESGWSGAIHAVTSLGTGTLRVTELT